ncbi:MAG: MFS transporter [Clostridia bacterium]|nr:MFS transporter [Clostridia bacterium]
MTKRNNRFCFGLGTLGRDAVYTLISMYLITYLTETVGLGNAELAIIGGLMVIFRIFDAINDPIMGTIVDNTRTKYGKFKPWIIFGSITSGILTVLLFCDFGLSGGWYIALFAVCYLLWGMAYTTNDISYWSMMPAITKDRRLREGIGAVARICANIGMFAVVVLYTMVPDLIPLPPKRAYLVFAVILVLLMWGFQLFTIFGVREERGQTAGTSERTTLRGMVRALLGNDQLMVSAVAMALFMIGYCTTTSFGVYYFKYAYGDEGTYTLFAAVLGVAQLTALSIFPLFSKRFTRRQLYFGSMITVVASYILFFLSFENLALIVISGLALFFAQAFIQLLMLLFIADAVEYGEWKLGRRNESVSFAVQPFINKLGGAVGTGVVTVTLIISGINPISQKLAGLEDALAKATDPAEIASLTAEIDAALASVSSSSVWIMKCAMMILPLICILAGFLIWRKFFKIDEATYENIIKELDTRRTAAEDTAETVTDAEASDAAARARESVSEDRGKND